MDYNVIRYWTMLMVSKEEQTGKRTKQCIENEKHSNKNALEMRGRLLGIREQEREESKRKQCKT